MHGPITKKGIYYILVFFAFYVALFSLASADAPDLTVEQARNCLSTTKPNATMVSADRFPPTPVTIGYAKLFKEQMAALACLSKNKSTDNIALLIPFLDYTYNADNLFQFQQWHQNADRFEEAKAAFPALAIIVATPGVAPILRNYCLDRKNPIDYRLTAFLIMRYLDGDVFKKLSNDLNLEFGGQNANILACLKGIEDGEVKYWMILRIAGT